MTFANVSFIFSGRRRRRTTLPLYVLTYLLTYNAQYLTTHQYELYCTVPSCRKRWRLTDSFDLCSCGRDPDDVSYCRLMPFDEVVLGFRPDFTRLMMMRSSGWQTSERGRSTQYESRPELSAIPDHTTSAPNHTSAFRRRRGLVAIDDNRK